MPTTGEVGLTYPLVVVLPGGQVHSPANSLFVNNPTLPILMVPLLELRVIHSGFLLIKENQSFALLDLNGAQLIK